MMPQLGETVTEGTITRWMKGVGDTVDRDEPLFEVSTDKVDSEVPSPAAGVLTEILVPEGETVEVGVKLAVIGDGAEPAAPPAAEAAPTTTGCATTSGCATTTGCATTSCAAAGCSATGSCPSGCTCACPGTRTGSESGLCLGCVGQRRGR